LVIVLQGEQRFDGIRLVLLLQRVDQVEPLRHRFESLRIGFQAISFGGDLGGHVFQVERGAVQPGIEGVGLRIDPGDPTERHFDLFDPTEQVFIGSGHLLRDP